MRHLFSLYLLPLGSILKKHNISFIHFISVFFFSDDLQIYLPIKREGDNSLRLLDCFYDIKNLDGRP